MRQFNVLAILGISTLLAGCASTPLVLQPVGPCSANHEGSDRTGHLQVFSALVSQSQGDDLEWYEHSAYSIYDTQGKRLKFVRNSAGRFDDTPETVTLPSGNYTVRAGAEGYRYPVVIVPVVIEPGKTTAVELESGLNPPSCPSKKT